MFIRSVFHNNFTLKVRVLFGASVFCFFILGILPAPSIFAQGVAATPLVTQTAAKPPNTSTSAKSLPTQPTPSKPLWKDLTPAQQLSLEPLAANWNTLEEAQKRKWIALAANYPTLTPAEQTKLHSRMTEWVSLSNRQREQARLNFAKSKQLTSTEKTATWQAYQALTPEEKQKLATVPLPKLAGAAIATKPVPPQKLTTVPVTRQSPIQPHKIANTNQEVNRHTLLPLSKPSAPPAPK